MTGNAVDDECAWRADMAAAAEDCMGVQESVKEEEQQEEQQLPNCGGT